MDKARTTPKDFFLWAGAMVSLYWSAVAFIGLIFDYINYALPNSLSYYQSDPYQGGISYEMASLIILFPLAIILMRVIHRDIARDESRSNIWVRRWALFLTLFIAGATIAGDLIVLLTSFLNGSDLTTAFVLKVVVVFLVAAGAFMHFFADFRGYWDTYPARSHAVGYGAALLVVVAIVAGFFIVGTPAHARLMRLDTEKVSDLQNIQSQVVSYWQAKQALPASLSNLNDSISGFTVPTDVQTGAAYEYDVTSATSFKLCATFNASSAAQQNTKNIYAQPYGAQTSDSWSHAAGSVCFDRTIDPTRYPPTK